jgi:hypothetical protein
LKKAGLLVCIDEYDHGKEDFWIDSATSFIAGSSMSKKLFRSPPMRLYKRCETDKPKFEGRGLRG